MNYNNILSYNKIQKLQRIDALLNELNSHRPLTKGELTVMSLSSLL